MPGVSLSTEGVWRELHANIRGFVARRVRQPADVDDIVQRVFLHVHRALPTLRDAGSLHAWIYQMTRRAIADHYRAPSFTHEVASGSAEETAEHLVAEGADESEEQAFAELSTCLGPLIRSLRPADREALQLVEFDGLTQVEAAGRLGLSVSGMKSRVQRARQHLRSALDDCCRVVLDARGGVIDYQTRSQECSPCAPAAERPAPRPGAGGYCAPTPARRGT